MGNGAGAAVGGLVGAIAGYALAPFTGGISLALFVAASSAIGTYAGGQADMALTAPVQGPRLGDVQMSTGTYGLPIPRGWGVYRLPANYIWTDGIHEHPAETSGKKGKGMKSPGSVAYTYSANFACAFAIGPADRILKIYADGKPVFDVTDPTMDGIGGSFNDDILQAVAANALGNAIFPFRFYSGSETQLPDPLIAETVGAERCPAFRGLVYIVCEGVNLAPFGNRLPNISAEIAFAGSGGGVATRMLGLTAGTVGALPVGVANHNSAAAFDGTRGAIYRSVIGSGSSTFGQDGYIEQSYGLPMETTRAVSVTETFAGTGITVPPTYSPGSVFPYWSQLGSADGSLLYGVLSDPGVHGQMLVAIDPTTLKAAAKWGSLAYAFNYPNLSLAERMYGAVVNVTVCRVLTAEGIADMPVLTFMFGGPMVFLGPSSTLGGAVSGMLQYVWGADDDGTAPTLTYTGLLAHNEAIEGKRALGYTECWLLNWYHFLGFSPTVECYLMSLGPALVTFAPAWSLSFADAGFVASEGSGLEVVKAEYDRANDALILHVGSDGAQGGGTAPATRIVSVSRTGAVRWSTSAPAPAGSAMGRSRLLSTSYSYATFSTMQTVDLRSGTVTSRALPAAAYFPDGTATLNGSPLGSQAFDSVTGLVWSTTTAGMTRYYLGLGSADSVPLADVVADICDDCGMAPADYDVSQLTSDEVRGYLVTAQPGRDAIAQLGAAFLFDSVESGDQIKFVKRGGSPVATVPYSRILAGNDGRALKPARTQAYDLPRAVTLRYPDPTNGYQQGTQQYSRVTGPASVRVINSSTDVSADTALIMSADEARTMAKRALLMTWAERETLGAIALPPAFLSIEPADVVNVGLPDGVNLARLRVSRVDIGADYTLSVTGVVEDASLVSVTAPGDAGNPYLVPGLPAPYSVQPELFALPLLEDADDAGGAALRIYAGAAAYPGQKFSGATYLVSTSATANFGTLTTVSQASPTGSALSALADVADAGITDIWNVLDVSMSNGGDELASVTREQMLDGANTALLVTSAGLAEVLQFQTVEPLGSNRYRLSVLMRGRRGSERATSGHATGDRFVLVTDALREASVPNEALNAPRYIKTMGLFDSTDATNALPTVFAGAAETPYAPTHLKGTRDGSNNLAVTWIRRTRLGGEWSDNTESVPLGEETESYDAEVLNGLGAVLRTYTGLTGAALSYTAAQQTSDGLTPGAEVTVRVYQRSGLVGRGYPATATV